MPKKFDPEMKARAVRMLRQHLPEYGSVTKTSAMVGQQLQTATPQPAAAHMKTAANPGRCKQAYREIREDGHPVVVLAGADLVRILKDAGLGSADVLRAWLAQKYPRLT